MKFKILLCFLIIYLSHTTLNSQDLDTLKTFINDYIDKIEEYKIKRTVSPSIFKLNNISDSTMFAWITWDGYSKNKCIFSKKGTGIGGDDIFTEYFYPKSGQIKLIYNAEFGSIKNCFTSKTYYNEAYFMNDTLVFYNVKISRFFLKIRINSYTIKYYFQDTKPFSIGKKGFTLKNKKNIIEEKKRIFKWI